MDINKDVEENIMEYQDMVVIFVDILGTRNNTEFVDKLKIHRIFHEEARRNENRKHNHVIYDRKVFSFSDCAYYLYYYKEGIEEYRKDKMKLLQVAMTNTSISMLSIFEAGYLVRGGIAYGSAYLDELGFFGPAIEKAYEIESKIADIPIIMLEPNLGREFSEWEKVNTDFEQIKHFYFDKPWVVENYGNKFFMNPFFQIEAGAPTIQIGDSLIEIESLKQSLLDKLETDKIKYKQKQVKEEAIAKSSVYDKLDWFEKYVKNRHNMLLPEHAEGALTLIVSGD